MLAPVRTVAPTEALLSLSDVKAHLRVDHADEDAVIVGLMDAALAHLDGYRGILGRALVTQTWTVEFPSFSDRLEIPLAPVQSATVQYYDSTDSIQTLAASVYAVLTDGLSPYITLKYNQQWPQTYTRDDAVKITFVAGYGGASSVPPAIRAAALLLIGHWYANREAVSEAQMAEVPLAVSSLLGPFRRVGT
jgi:uncharacterized phiE125 gp8 family phage protein